MKGRIYPLAMGDQALRWKGFFARPFSSNFKTKKYSHEVIYDPLLKEGAKVVLPISMGKYLPHSKESLSVLEKRRAEYDDTLNMLFTSVSEMLKRNAIKSVDVIITTELHHHWTADQIKEIEDHFFHVHREMLAQPIRSYTWNAWIDQMGRDRFDKNYQEILRDSAVDSKWYHLMAETYQRTQMDGDLQESLQYQRREYAAIRMMSQYDNIVYLGPLSTAWAYLYKIYSETERLPLFTGATVRKLRPLATTSISEEGASSLSKNTRPGTPPGPVVEIIESNVKNALYDDRISDTDKAHIIHRLEALFFASANLFSRKKAKNDINDNKEEGNVESSSAPSADTKSAGRFHI